MGRYQDMKEATKATKEGRTEQRKEGKKRTRLSSVDSFFLSACTDMGDYTLHNEKGVCTE